MTVASETNRNDYVGNGATAVYPYTFRVFDKAHLAVFHKAVDSALTELVLDVDYTVAGAGSYSGGTITLTAGNLPAGDELSIRRRLDLVQETDLRNQGAFFAEDIENVFDRLVMVDQQQQDELNRCLKLGETDAGVANLSLPKPEARMGIGWNEAGDGLKNYSVMSAGFVDLADGSVITSKLADLAVTADKIAVDAVQTVKIVDGAVTADKLASDAVQTAKVVDEAITTAKLADGSVVTAKIPDGAVTASKIPDGSLSDAKLAAALKRQMAKAWGAFDGTQVGVDMTGVKNSFNVSSVVDNGSGDYTVNFTTPFDSTNFAVVATHAPQGTLIETLTAKPVTASSIQIWIHRAGDSSNTGANFTVDKTYVSFVAYGDQ